MSAAAALLLGGVLLGGCAPRVRQCLQPELPFKACGRCWKDAEAARKKGCALPCKDNTECGNNEVCSGVPTPSGRCSPPKCRYNMAMTAQCTPWHLRGTPNKWGATTMWPEPSFPSMFCTVVDFAAGGEFKVSHSATLWDKAYPAENLVVPVQGRYQVCFNADSKEIQLKEVAWWYFRGTPNQWGATPLEKQPDSGLLCLHQNFVEGNKFKISAHPNSFDVSYPELDFTVSETGAFLVCFDPTSKAVTAELLLSSVSWYFRGTPNKWGATPMSYVLEWGLYCAPATFLNTEGEFKISRSADSWDEAYPESNVLVPESGRFYACIKEETKEVSVRKMEWWFRGHTNDWNANKMTFDLDTQQFCIAQVFAAGNAFKISKYAAEWGEAYPDSNYVVEEAGTHKVCFDDETKDITVTRIMDSDWWFRGAPNRWSADPMPKNPTTGLHCTVQLFRNPTDGFKVASSADDWSQPSFPAEDQIVPETGSWEVCFNEDTKEITLRLIFRISAGNRWFFRGTPNSWGATEMEEEADGRWCTQQVFTVPGSGFKISRNAESWSEAYPDEDYIVPKVGGYHICFNATSLTIEATFHKGISVPETPTPTGEEWFFRGEPNRWGSSPMDYSNTTGLFCTLQVFSGNGAGFKISKYPELWVESYPEENMVVEDGWGFYQICFNSSSKEVLLEKQVEPEEPCTVSLKNDAGFGFTQEMRRTMLDNFLDQIDAEGVGAVMAAPDTDTPGGSYYFHWMRDGALTMLSFMSIHGFRNTEIVEKMQKYASWVQKVQNQTNPNGGTILAEPKFYIPDGRAFTGSWCRPQSDGPGLRAHTLVQFAQASPSEANTIAPLVRADLDWVADNWRSNSCDLWEEIRTRDFFWNRMAFVKALRTGADLMQALGDGDRASKYNATADEIHGTLSGHWNGRYFFGATEREIDGSVLHAIVTFGGDDAEYGHLSPKVASTLTYYEAMNCRMFRINQDDNREGLPGVLIGRYPGDSYAGGNPWQLLTAVLAHLYYKVAQSARAGRNVPQEWLDHLGVAPADVPRAALEAGDAVMLRLWEHVKNDGGRVDEQIDKYTGKQTSSSSLTWSYGNILDALTVRDSL